MKYRSKKILFSAPAFTLVEVVTALIILALICSSVLVVVNRCTASAADSELRMRAFEVARDNMETLLSKNSVENSVEYGSSAKYPEIKWQNTVELFYEPAMEQKQIWVKAICSAEFIDASGKTQTIELTQWLTGLTRQQLIQMLKQEQSNPLDANSPSDSNAPVDTNKPALDQNTPQYSPNISCDELPFCESITCLLDAAVPGRPTAGEMVKYLNECR
jgi:hypothetical protein